MTHDQTARGLGPLIEECFAAATLASYRQHFSGTSKLEAFSEILNGTFLQCLWGPRGSLNVTVTVSGRYAWQTEVYFWRFQRYANGTYECLGGSLDL
jgi:hypothetical protein